MTRRRMGGLCFGFAGLGAVIYLAFSATASANHVHMHGGPFVGVIMAVAADPAEPRTLYVAAHGGGVFRSIDHGATWTAINNGLPSRQVFGLVIHPKKSSTLYLATDEGLSISDDRGANWRSRAKNLAQRNIRAVVIDPAEPEVVYAATDQGVFTGSKDRWRRDPIAAADDVRALALNAHGTLFAATFNGIYLKPRGARQWREAVAGLSDRRVRALSVDPLAPETLYAGTATSGVFKSVNGGVSWQSFNRGLLNSTVLSLLRVPLPENPLYVGTVDGIFKASAGVNQWQSIGPDLPFSVSALAYNPKHPRLLYAGSGGRLYISRDAGKGWREDSGEINYFGIAPRSAKK